MMSKTQLTKAIGDKVCPDSDGDPIKAFTEELMELSYTPNERRQILGALHSVGIGKDYIKLVLDAQAEIAASEINAGEDFTVPGIVRLSHSFTPASKKGEKYRKGDVYTGFGGVEVTAEVDSPAKAERHKVRASLASAVKAAVPAKGSKGYRSMVARKAK